MKGQGRLNRAGTSTPALQASQLAAQGRQSWLASSARGKSMDLPDLPLIEAIRRGRFARGPPKETRADKGTFKWPT